MYLGFSLPMSSVDAHATANGDQVGHATELPSTLDASNHTATERVIARWRARTWRNSVDCQRLIQLLLALRANQIHGHSQLAKVLARSLPPLFMPSSEEAFFAALQHETISDVDLRKSIVEFLARWDRQHLASYQDLLADSAVDRKADALLPKYIPLWLWIKKRLRAEMELREESGGWTIHVSQPSSLSSEVISQWKMLQDPHGLQ